MTWHNITLSPPCLTGWCKFPLFHIKWKFTSNWIIYIKWPKAIITFSWREKESTINGLFAFPIISKPLFACVLDSLASGQCLDRVTQQCSRTKLYQDEMWWPVNIEYLSLLLTLVKTRLLKINLKVNMKLSNKNEDIHNVFKKTIWWRGITLVTVSLW